MNNDYAFPDQDIVNIVLKDKILTLPLKYNFYGYFFEIDYGHVLEIFSIEHELYTQKEFDDAKKDIVCTHFLNLFSDVPWKDKTNPIYDEFKKYADKSTFSDDEIFAETDMPYWKVLIHRILKITPKKLYIPFAKKYMSNLFKNKFKKV